MYTEFFQLRQAPFSISPDPRYLFMSDRHREALAHLLYGIDSGGGVVVLTGDIGTGKTTICRCFLEQVPPNCNVAYIFNPKLSVSELLQSVCDEFHITLADDARGVRGNKHYIDALNSFLLTAHAEGRNNVLIIDEAQNLSAEVLEQLRLLTNLETNERKLLQIILIGQPELRTMLARPDLEQLAQRVIAHYHLTALTEEETASYIQHRLATAGLNTTSPFQPALIRQIHRLTGGVPRRINLLCDRAMLGAYANNTQVIDRNIIEMAGEELLINEGRMQAAKPKPAWRGALVGVLAGAIIAGGIGYAVTSPDLRQSLAMKPATTSGAADRERDRARTTPANPKSADTAIAEKAAPAPSPVAEVTLATSTEARADSVGAGTDTVPAPADSQALFSEQDGSSSAGLRDEHAAVSQLARFWGVTLEGDDPCEAAKKIGVRCHWSTGGFGEIRALDRPVAIKLQDQRKQVFHLLLTELSDTEATLRAGDVKQKVKLAVLGRYFRGDFVTLWRTPPGFTGAVKLGDSGTHVDWLATQLSTLNGVEPPVAGTTYGPRMVKQVDMFQQAHGLHVDGVLGPVTAMHINRAVGVDEPRLRDTMK
ncbi:AAA family ATPase [Herbaspirillum sp. GCM10030257]|uniref:ExeA family protein n=1 Tax=Herbaspirillum sp. GCM10030257 TaxID=3273393 RepID=UPI003618EAE9